jgi:hypothetical protein
VVDDFGDILGIRGHCCVKLYDVGFMPVYLNQFFKLNGLFGIDIGDCTWCDIYMNFSRLDELGKAKRLQ